MSITITRWAAPLAIAMAVALSACTEKKNDDTLAQDTSLNRDLQMANADTAAQPALKDVPAATAPTTAPTTTVPRTTPRVSAPPRRSSGGAVVRTPTRPAPAPAPAPTTATTSSGNTVTRSAGGSERAVGTIAAGSTLNLASNSRVCTNTNRVGQHFTATVSETVSGSNGVTIPAGATANIEITELKRSENANDNVVMGFRVTSVSFGGRTYPVAATTSYARVEKVRNQPKDKDIQKVAGGAAVGAIIGQVLGKSTKGTVIGAAAGAAAGTAAAAATSNYEGCVPDGGRITVSLDSPVQVQA
jgi:hypothetical protein